MNYINQINLMNRIRKKDSLSPVAIALHVILLDECNSNDWEDFRMKNGILESMLGVKFRSLSSAREQLQNSGLIKFKTKNGTSECSYQILSPEECKEYRTFALNAKVSDEVHVEVSAEVSAEVGVKVEGVYILGESLNRNENRNRKEESADKPHSKNHFKKSNPEKGKEKSYEQKESSVYTACMKIYHDWFIEKYQIGPNIDALQGKSLKSIVTYFSSNLKRQHGDDLPESELNDKTQKAWVWVLSNWDKLDDFRKQNTKLNQISSDIQNIIVKIKNHNQDGNGNQKGNNFGGAVADAEQVLKNYFGNTQD